MIKAFLFRPMLPAWLIVLLTLLLLGAAVWFLATRPRERTTWVLRALMVVLVAGILLRPGVGQTDTGTMTTSLEVLVVVDRTTSMSALDWNGDDPRLAGVKEDLAELTELLPGARFALMTFGRFVRTELPFSSDSGAFVAAVQTMQREEPFDGTGSALSIARDDMRDLLERAAEQNQDRQRLVIFVSDGEQTGDNPQQSFDAIADLIDGGAVLGYGTSEGGRMLVFEDRPGRSFVYDESSRSDAVSKIDEENLRQIAGELDVNYLHRTGPGGLDQWADDLKGELESDGSGAPAKHELYWILALMLFGLALAELRISWRGLRSAHKEVSSL